MELIKLQCPNCGASLTVAADKEKAFCEYCGAEIDVPREEAEIKVKRRKLNAKALKIFGVITAVIVIAAVITVLGVGKKEKPDPRVYKTAGVYLASEDIPAGEYVLYPSVKKSDGDVVPVVEVRKTREAATNSSDFLYRKDVLFRQYVNLNEGEYIAFEYAVMYLPEKAKLKELDESGYGAAQLKVGADIEAGEYVIVGSNKQTHYFITSKLEIDVYGSNSLNLPEMLSFDSCENRLYVKVKNGEWLSYGSGRLYRPSEAPAPETMPSGALPAGQYKVGVDIESGKYAVVAAENKNSQAWICINKNSVSTDDIDSWENDIIAGGGETLEFVRFGGDENEKEITIPNADGRDIYVTFRYCFAEKKD